MRMLLSSSFCWAAFMKKSLALWCDRQWAARN